MLRLPLREPDHAVHPEEQTAVHRLLPLRPPLQPAAGGHGAAGPEPVHVPGVLRQPDAALPGVRRPDGLQQPDDLRLHRHAGVHVPGEVRGGVLPSQTQRHHHELQKMQMVYYCGKQSAFIDQVSDLYDRVFTYFLFLLGGAAVVFSYAGIIVAARSASTDKASASRARRTLLLHLLQMGLSMSAVIYNSLLIVLTSNMERVLSVHLQIFMYVCLIILPKCLSSLIYGLRDQNIRPILVMNLICCCRASFLIPGLRNKNTVRARAG